MFSAMLLRCLSAVLFLSLSNCMLFEESCTSFGTEGAWTEEETQALLQAVENSNKFLQRNQFRLARNGICPIEKGKLPDKAGAMWYSSGYIVIDTEKMAGIERDPETRLKLMTHMVSHEFMHSVGMDHHPGRGIMNPEVSAVSEFTEEDKAACIAQGICEP